VTSLAAFALLDRDALQLFGERSRLYPNVRVGPKLPREAWHGGSCAVHSRPDPKFELVLAALIPYSRRVLLRDSTPMNKSALKEELIRVVAADLATLERAHRATMEGATHEQAKPENDKDTRALEQSYLARGQAKRTEDLREGLVAIRSMEIEVFTADKPVGVGALVTAQEGKRTIRFFLALHGGGSRLAQGSVQVVTPRSPLGEALIGKRVGDDCEVLTGGSRREFELVAIE
jgi:transcription elongation GreA/GreB family factor